MRNYRSGHKPQSPELVHRMSYSRESQQEAYLDDLTSLYLFQHRSAHTQASGRCTLRFRAHLPPMAYGSETESNGNQALCNPRRSGPL